MFIINVSFDAIIVLFTVYSVVSCQMFFLHRLTYAFHYRIFLKTLDLVASISTDFIMCDDGYKCITYTPCANVSEDDSVQSQ